MRISLEAMRTSAHNVLAGMATMGMMGAHRVLQLTAFLKEKIGDAFDFRYSISNNFRSLKKVIQCAADALANNVNVPANSYSRPACKATFKQLFGLDMVHFPPTNEENIEITNAVVRWVGSMGDDMSTWSSSLTHIEQVVENAEYLPVLTAISAAMTTDLLVDCVGRARSWGRTKIEGSKLVAAAAVFLITGIMGPEIVTMYAVKRAFEGLLAHINRDGAKVHSEVDDSRV